MEHEPLRSPLCIRLTKQERQRLEQDAGDMPLSAYVRSRLFDENHTAPRKRFKRPIKDHEALGRVLAELGNSRITNNLNQLARAANSGSLPLCPETERDIHEAYITIQSIRQSLMAALGSQ